MTPPSKREIRRSLIQSEFWFKKYGNPARPGRFTREARKHLKINQA